MSNKILTALNGAMIVFNICTFTAGLNYDISPPILFWSVAMMTVHSFLAIRYFLDIPKN